MAIVEWEIGSTFEIEAGEVSTPGTPIRWRIGSSFSIDVPIIEGETRVVIVNDEGGAVAELENAVVSSVTFSLNTWETASFTILLDDPKARYVFAQVLREVQIWRGDQLLIWGPMTRPQVTDNVATVSVNGAGWYLSRRFVGKANRDNLLANPSFEQGIVGWNWLKTAAFFTYQTLLPYDVVVYRPGIDGEQAVEINADIAPWVHDPSSIGSGTVATHNVGINDNLWNLAKTYYGSGTEWWRIYEANAALIQTSAIEDGMWNPKNPGGYLRTGDVLDIPGVPVSQAITEQTPWPEFPWGDVFGYQEFEIDGGERGVTLTLAGWVKIPSTEFEGWPTHFFGLQLERMPLDWRTNNYYSNTGQDNSWGGARGLYTEVIEEQHSLLQPGHPFDGWIRHEVSITVPPGETEKVIARLNGVNGRTYYDRLTLTLDTAFEMYNADQHAIVEGLVEHAQDPAFDKDDLNIEVEYQPSGVRRTLVALHSEHANIWSLLMEFTQLRDGFDIGMRYTPTRRILTPHYPRQGTLRHSLELIPGRNVSSIQWTFDGEAAASAVIILGTGDGSDREEAAAADPTAFADGKLLETVEVVGPETPIDMLHELAEETLAVLKQPEMLMVTTYPHLSDVQSRNFIGHLHPGDTVPVAIRLGRYFDAVADDWAYAFDLAGHYRVVSMTLFEDSSLGLTLNRRDWEGTT